MGKTGGWLQKILDLSKLGFTPRTILHTPGRWHETLVKTNLHQTIESFHADSQTLLFD